MTREANALFLEAQYLHTRTRTEDNSESRYALGNHSERCRSVGAGGERIDLVVNREGKWRVQANAYICIRAEAKHEKRFGNCVYMGVGRLGQLPEAWQSENEDFARTCPTPAACARGEAD